MRLTYGIGYDLGIIGPVDIQAWDALWVTCMGLHFRMSYNIGMVLHYRMEYIMGSVLNRLKTSLMTF